MLDAHEVRLVGIGLEEFGKQEFIDGGFFKGEIFIDQNQSSYKALEFKRYNAVTVVASLVEKESRNWNAKSNAAGIPGNFKGDGMQSGGTLVIEKGGKVLLSHKQKNPGDHVELKDILESLGIDKDESTAAAAAATSGGGITCTDDVCTRN